MFNGVDNADIVFSVFVGLMAYGCAAIFLFKPPSQSVQYSILLRAIIAGLIAFGVLFATLIIILKLGGIVGSTVVMLAFFAIVCWVAKERFTT